MGIVELPEVDPSEVQFANMATRGQVLTGDSVMIGGFVIQRTSPQPCPPPGWLALALPV